MSGCHERGHQAARIAKDVQHLFARHGAGAAEVHAAAFSCSSIRLTNTSSIDGVIGSSVPILIPAPSSAPRISRIGRSFVVHFHVQPAAEHRDVQQCPACLRSAVMLPSRSEVSRFSRWPYAERRLQFRRRTERDHPAAVHQRDAMAVLGFVHVVRGDEDGVAGLGKLVNQLPETAARDRIDAAGGLVQKQNRRLVQNRAAQRQALFPAAREQRASSILRLSSRPAILQNVIARARPVSPAGRRRRRRRTRCSPPPSDRRRARTSATCSRCSA